jgi:hypothetical protein
MYVPQDKRKATRNGKKNESSQINAAPPRLASDHRHSDAETSSSSLSTSESTIDVQEMLTKEFDGTRGEVIREVERSPDRATDNILNLLKNTASKLKVN